MSGYDEHATIFGEWMPLSPSPRAFFKSILEHPLESKAETLFQESNEQQIISRDNNDQFTQFRPFLEQKMGARGGLVERMAARAGFNAPRLNTESIIRPPDLAPNSDVRSPYLTISPGLSPTTLLESPIFLSNSLVQASPTTGKFQFAPEKNKNQFQDIDSTSFAFKPVAESGLSTFFSAAGKITPTLQSEISRSQSEEQPKLQSQSGAAPHLPVNLSRGNTVISEARIIDTVTGSDENSPALDDQQDEETDQMGGGDGSGTTSEDGYNWRKYGQKQVKGSDYPRSYYKCTHLNCPVKKKVERSHEGHITEIIYKGAHNHPKPQPNRRSTLGLIDPQMETSYRSGEDPMWTITQKGRNDNHEISEYCNGTNSFQGQNGTHFESVNVKDGSSTFSNDEEEDDPVIHGSASLGYDGEGDESDSKRRKIEEYASEMSGATRAAREPRVVVQTTSEVDILDDGYRWRKYGQKVVKGNPNPRSYYKCTSSGCLVRKHVERASHDLKSVITTYEGKHNHDVPAARNCGQTNSGSPGNGRTEAGNTISASTHLQRPEPSQVHNNISRFSRPLVRNPLGFAFGMNHPGLADLAMARLGPNQGNLFDPLCQPQFGQLSEMDFVLPKGEPKSEPLSEAPLSMPNASSVYSQYMSRLPLGPHM